MFSTTSPYYRKLAGVLTSYSDFENLCRELARNSACQIVLMNEGTLALYPWGSSRSNVEVLGPNDCRVEEVRVLDPSFVINNATIGYNKTLTKYDARQAAIGELSGDYAGVIKRSKNTNSVYATFIGQSEALYGRRFLEQITFDFISDSQSAELQALYVLSSNPHPTILVDIVAPLSRYKHLQMKDCIQLIQPDLPNFYGSSFNSLPGHLDGQLIDPTGQTYTRAKTYRAQILSRFINLSDVEGPSLRFTCKLLYNMPGDPT